MRTNILYAVGLLLVLAFIGCEKPGPIQIEDPVLREPIEVKLFDPRQRDTTIVSEPTFYFTGLTEEDESRYPATILVAGAKTDVGDIRTTLSYSRLLVQDRDSLLPVQGNFGRYDGYYHLDVGKAKLNNAELERTQFIIQIRSSIQIFVPAGVFYKLLNENNSEAKEFIYRPNVQYIVDAEGRSRIKPFTRQLQSPDEITLTAPTAKSLLFRDEDLILRWSGWPASDLRVIISGYNEATAKPDQPLMILRVVPRANAVVVPPKLMRLLPPVGSGKYMITLISANRFETGIEGYRENVLMQAASIHNVVCSIR